jgi:hypothetical protein
LETDGCGYQARCAGLSSRAVGFYPTADKAHVPSVAYGITGNLMGATHIS